MIRIKNKSFTGNFLPTFDKLMASPGLNQRVAWNIAKISKPLRRAAGEAQAEFIKLVNQFGLKDEKGELVPSNGPGTFLVDPTKISEWNEAMEKFEAKEVVLDKHPLMVNDLQQANLSPNDYLALEPLIMEMDVVDELPVAPTPLQGA